MVRNRGLCLGWEHTKLIRFMDDESSRIPKLVGNSNTIGSTTEGAKGMSLEFIGRKSQNLDRSKHTTNYYL